MSTKDKKAKHQNKSWSNPLFPPTEADFRQIMIMQRLAATNHKSLTAMGELKALI